MIEFIARLLAWGEPVLAEASMLDAPDLAELHAFSFRRGWSDSEFARLIRDQNVVAHSAAVAGISVATGSRRGAAAGGAALSRPARCRLTPALIRS